MSRTSGNSSTKIKSPLKCYVQYGAKKGQFEYWDGEKVVSFDELEMVLMDDRKCITGYNKKRGKRIISNRVQSVVKEPLTVRCGDDVIAEGMYEQIKDKVVVNGGKFTNELFALAKIDGEFVPVSICFAGSANGCWIDFLNESGGKFSLYKSVVKAVKGEFKTEGQSEFYTLKFSTDKLPMELDVQANEFNDDFLQPYLTQGQTAPEAVVA